MKQLAILGVVSACVVQNAPPPEPQSPAAPRLADAAAATTPPIDAAPPADEAALIQACADAVAARGITLYLPRHKDGKTFWPSDGYLAPTVPTRDGGCAYSGLAGTRLVIGKLDAWEIVYEEQGYAAYEGGQVIEDAAGHVRAFVPSYVDPGWFPQYRIVELDGAGKIVWERKLPRDKHKNSPQIHLGRLEADGSIRLQGHTYQGKPGKEDRPALRWTATITPTGALTDEQIGAALDWSIDEW